MMRSVIILCLIAFHTGMAIENERILAKRGCNSCGESSFSKRTQTSGLSLRELLQLLPFLSAGNSAPVGGVTQIHAPLPALTGIPPANPQSDTLAAIAQLAKMISKRQIDQQKSISEAKNQLSAMLGLAAESVQSALHSNASTSGSNSTRMTNAHFAITGVNHTDPFEFEDYGVPPQPGHLDKYMGKCRIGQECAKDEDCARGAKCEEKICQCRPPFVNQNQRCVPVQWRGH